MEGYNLVSLAGIAALVAVAWGLSGDRRRFPWRVVLWGTGLQLVFGVFVFWIPFGSQVFLALSDVVVEFLKAADSGIRFCFGALADASGQGKSPGFVLIIHALPTIVFFAAAMEILYFAGVMPFVVRQFARLFTRVMGVSGAESLCTASNIFVGIESMTTIRPHLERMTRSELCTILTAGMATVASSVLGIYVRVLQGDFPQIASHLISASVLSAPAALVMSKVLVPETEVPETRGRAIEVSYEKGGGWLEAAIRGATAGGTLVFGVVVLLLAFLGLVELVNLGLDGLSQAVAYASGVHVSLRLEVLLGYLFYPLTVITGVPPSDAYEVSKLLGVRAVMTEIPAYGQLQALMAGHHLQHGRSAILASYALCGFAHVASMAIFVGGTAALAPGQTRPLAKVAFRALLAATLACLMTAAVAGVFYNGHSDLFRLP